MDVRVFDHLWFLWFLCWLVVVFCVYAKIADWLKWNGPPAWILLPPVCFLWLIPLTLLPQWFMSRFGPDTSTGLLPFPRVILYYAIFFGFGSLYFDCKDEAGRLGRGWWLLLPIGLLVLFPLGYELTYGAFGIREQIVDALRIPSDSDIVKAAATFVQVLYVWTMTFGMMGLFRRLFRRENRTARYLSDASYWLYLTHLPLLFFVQFWLTGVRMPAIIKCTIACAVVVGFLLVLYQLVVRYTWLGRLLNGPRTRPQAAKEAVELAPAEA